MNITETVLMMIWNALHDGERKEQLSLLTHANFILLTRSGWSPVGVLLGEDIYRFLLGNSQKQRPGLWLDFIFPN
jgi:hypothetical protein